MKIRNVSRDHGYAIVRGWVGPGGAVPSSTTTVGDGTTTVYNVGTILGGPGITVTDLGNGTVLLTVDAISTIITPVPHGSMGSTETFDVTDGEYHYGTLNANCTFTFAGAVADQLAVLILELLEDGTGGWTITWPGSVVWANGAAPTADTTAGATTVYEFWSRDGGITWFGTAGSGTGVTYGTPAIVLGTSAAAGSIDEAIRRDATIVAFDATSPTTQAVGDSAVVGTAAVAARRDHKHAITRPALDDLSDVVITSATAGDRVRYDGSNFVNSALRWEPHVAYDGTVVLNGLGDPVMVEVV